jgi:hypothetical protein
MAANSADYFTKVGAPGTATTMTAPGHTTGGTSISVVSTANYPTTTGVIFAIDTVTIVNGKEVRDVGSYTEWEGTVGGATTLENMVLRLGTDQNYPAGSTTRVYIPVTTSQNDRMVDGLLVSHDQDGTLKAGAVDNAACLASDVVETAKIKDANVTAAKLATNLGYAVRSTAISGTTDDITDLSVTVTVPAGAKVLVEAFACFTNKYNGVQGVELYIKEGATQLAIGGATMPALNYNGSVYAGCILTPTTGSHTYKAASGMVNGTCDLDPPAYLRVTIIG